MICRSTDVKAALRSRQRGLALRSSQRGFIIDPFKFGGAGGATRLLLNMNGTNGSTSFPDSSGWAHGITRHGSAQITTSNSKYGGASALLGTGNYLSTTLTTSWNLRNDRWCAEAWVYTSDADNFSLVSGGSGGNQFYIMRRSGTWYLGDGSVNVIASGSSPPTVNTWEHVACSFDLTTYRLFLNGTVIASTTSLLNNINITTHTIGYRASEGLYVAGMDDFRLTVTLARYTSNFTAPTAQLTP